MTATDGHDLLRLVEGAWDAAGDEARPEARDRLHALGKQTALERIDALVDPGSFRPIGQLARLPDGEYDGLPGIDEQAVTAYGDGVVAGSARIDGRPVMITANDYSIFGGSGGVIGGRLTQRVTQLARQHGTPLIMLLDGGGHRIQDGLDSRHFANTGPHFMTLVRMSGWVPVITLMLGPGFAGNTNYAGLADFVVMVRGTSTMGIAGPALVRAATGEQIDKEDLGGADVQVERNGIAHLAVDDEAAAFAAARQYLSYLPSNADAPLPVVATDDTADRRSPELVDMVPANTRRAYDVRKVLRTVVDEHSFFEIQPGYAKNIVVGFARLDGRPVGLIANQPMVLAGTLDSPACEKAARFVSLCDAFGLPLVFFADIPGFLVGTHAEDSGLGRRSARMIFELGRATVPRCSVILRKGYGLGYLAMCGGRSFDADLAVAWPTAEICAMNIEGAVDVAFRKVYEGAEDPAEARAELMALFDARVGPLQAAAGFGVDALIDPADTRRLLIETLERAPRRRDDGLGTRTRGISPI
ncbi:MAG: acyl-CoA carboxylase subunit beta [Desertimonas sp.]